MNFRFGSALALSLSLTSLPAMAIDVVASIKPIHSLVAGVMDGVGTPKLIVSGNGSPHDYHLKPSDARSLQNADVIFWIGDEFETFLTAPLKNINKKASIVAFETLNGVLLEEKEEADHNDHDDHDHDEHEKHDDHADHNHGDTDLHLWLNPQNAEKMVHAIAETLEKIDPANAHAYHKNAEALEKRLYELGEKIEADITNVKKVPFVVFHDAYGHFEHRFNTNVVAKITLSPEKLPGAKRLKEVRHTIEETHAACVFAEPQFNDKLVNTVVEGTHAKTGVLDPVGGTLDAGKEMYFTLLTNMSNSLKDCLSSK